MNGVSPRATLVFARMSEPQRERGDARHRGGNGSRFDMHAAARRVLAAAGFEAQLDAPPQGQLAAIAGPAALELGVRDLRHLPWSSIDNNESRDLDQVEVAELLAGDAIRLIVGIADVDVLVPKDTPLDTHAFANCTSVYTGIDVFPMLPEKLSTDFTSLNEGEDRLALAIETVVNAGGDVVSHDVYRAMVRNTAKLTYEGVGAYLDGEAPPP